MVGNLKVIILTATLRNWSQIKKKLKKKMRLDFWI